MISVQLKNINNTVILYMECTESSAREGILLFELQSRNAGKCLN